MNIFKEMMEIRDFSSHKSPNFLSKRKYFYLQNIPHRIQIVEKTSKFTWYNIN